MKIKIHKLLKGQMICLQVRVGNTFLYSDSKPNTPEQKKYFKKVIEQFNKGKK